MDRFYCIVEQVYNEPLWCLHDSFPTGVNPMTNSRNCTCQQSSVNRLDQRNISVKHGCFAQLLGYDVLLCMSKIVCYKSAEGEFAGCSLSGSLRLS